MHFDGFRAKCDDFGSLDYFLTFDVSLWAKRNLSPKIYLLNISCTSSLQPNEAQGIILLHCRESMKSSR